MNKKLQVFVSSTYTDLIEERQAAVEAILDAGHIPAGMELFKAGNASQLQTIYKWIDESDVYMLILGGRYGSIEDKSGKSYTQLEYEYALSKDIPVFAVVLNDSFLTKKINSLGLDKTMEQNTPDKYQTFKSLVMSKIIREVDDCKDIKIAIHTTLNEFMNEYDLFGWVRNNYENDMIQLLEDYNIVIKENNTLNKQIQKLHEQINTKSKVQFGNFSFDELTSLFTNKIFELPIFEDYNLEKTTWTALDFFYSNFNLLSTGVSNKAMNYKILKYIFYNIAPYYMGFDLLEKVKLPKSTAETFQTTKLGNSFYALLEVKNNKRPK